jgi:hypothetical protein
VSSSGRPGPCMTPSSVTQFITITFPISCPFGLDGAIQMLAPDDED